MDFFDVARTQRAMRRLKPDPISDADLWTILETATMAPSGGNRQPWNFIVVRDPEKKNEDRRLVSRCVGEGVRTATRGIQRDARHATHVQLRRPPRAKHGRRARADHRNN